MPLRCLYHNKVKCLPCHILETIIIFWENSPKSWKKSLWQRKQATFPVSQIDDYDMDIDWFGSLQRSEQKVCIKLYHLSSQVNSRWKGLGVGKYLSIGKYLVFLVITFHCLVWMAWTVSERTWVGWDVRCSIHRYENNPSTKCDVLPGCARCRRVMMMMFCTLCSPCLIQRDNFVSQKWINKMSEFITSDMSIYK